MVNRRDFMRIAAIAAFGGISFSLLAFAAEQAAEAFYDLPGFGNVHYLHMTDCHAQLLPIYFREPSINIGIGEARNRPPHIVGKYFLDFYGIDPKTASAHALTYLDFTEAARKYGKVGGFAHLSTLVQQMRASRPDRKCV